MTSERIQVHASHLPRRASCNRSPLCCTELQRRQHLERHIRHFTRLALLERFEVARNFRQNIERVIAADEVTEQCFARYVLWLWVYHLHNIGQRWILAHVRLEERCRIASIQPLAHQTLWRRTQRLTTDCTRTH